MPVDIDLTGLSNVNRRIKLSITQGLVDAGKQVHDLAQQLAPELTGDLKNSGEVNVIDDYTVEVSFGNNLLDDRAPSNEYGTVYSPAQPFLIPAARQIKIAPEIQKYLMNDK